MLLLKFAYSFKEEEELLHPQQQGLILDLLKITAQHADPQNFAKKLKDDAKFSNLPCLSQQSCMVKSSSSSLVLLVYLGAIL